MWWFLNTDFGVEIFCYLFIFWSENDHWSVLLAFRLNLFAWNQWHIKERSQFTCLIIFFSKWSVNSKFVSFPEWFTLQYWTELCMSLTKNINKRGQSTEPCGTTWDTVFKHDSLSLIKVHCILSQRNNLNQLYEVL